jgi:hypothetical protein
VLSLDENNDAALSSRETRQPAWLKLLPHRRRVGFFVAGGLCAIGVVVAVSNPADAPSNGTEVSGLSSVVDQTAPSQSAIDSSNEWSSNSPDSSSSPDEANRDPRAVVVELALSGNLDGIPQGLEDVTAEVASRNGDIVLVEAKAIADATESTFSVVLVRAAGSWIVREVYSNSDPS